MAINVTDSQLTKVYLVPVGTAVATAANCVSAIATAKELISIQSFGEIGSSRAVTEYKCIDTTDTTKSLGSFTLGNIAVQFLFDASDTKGQKELRDIYPLGTRKIMIVKYNDQITPTTGNPTYKTFTAACSAENNAIAIDTAILQNYTVEICSLPATILAT